MTHPLIRRLRPADDVPERDDTAGWDIDEAPSEIAGWSTGARANSVTMVRWAAWGLLFLGPLLSAAAFLSLSSAADTGRPQPVATAPGATGAQGAAGFAQLFVSDYVEAGKDDQDLLRPYYPHADTVRLEGERGRRHAEQLTVVRLRETDPSVWAVTVAARITATAPTPKTELAPAPKASPSDTEPTAGGPSADGVRYFQVPVAGGPAPGGATGYVALALPAEVSAPARITPPDLIYGPPRPALASDPRTQTVTDFLSAYLTGTGELDRYLAPGTRISAITPAPYTGIDIDQIAIEDEIGPVVSVPADATKQRLLVTLRATGTDGIRTPLAYALTLSARAGRWEIAALDGAPSRAPATQPPPFPTSTPQPTSELTTRSTP